MKTLSVIVTVGLLAGASSLAQAAPPLSPADQTFLQTAAQNSAAGMMEAELALKRAHRADIKRFAQRILAQDRRTNRALTRIAQHAGVKVGPPMSASAKMLDVKPANKFDLAYIGQERAEAHNTIELYQREDREGHYPPLKTFAARTLPVMQAQFRAAKALPGH